MQHTSIGTWGVIAFVFSTATATYPCPPQQAAVPTIQQQVREVVSHLVGAMDTSAQAQANPNAPNVRMTTCKIIVSRNGSPSEIPNPDAVFLYQEQAMSRSLDKPYRQRFLEILPDRDGKNVVSTIFKPPTSKAWTGLCNQPEEKRIVPLNDIGESNCRVLLQRNDEGYVGETPSGGCPTDYKNATSITNRIILKSAGMDTWDRGFDATGHQVWGAKDEPYQFRWINSLTPAQ